MRSLRHQAFLQAVQSVSCATRSTAASALLLGVAPWLPGHPHCRGQSLFAEVYSTVSSAHDAGGSASSPDVTGSTASSSSTNSSSPEHNEQSSRQENAYRRGFGAKVALPAKEVLQEVLVGHPATFKLRAYHTGLGHNTPRFWRFALVHRVIVESAGQRIHIGQVLQLAKAHNCRTNSGKDYCIIWLDPAALGSSMPSNSGSSSKISIRLKGSKALYRPGLSQKQISTAWEVMMRSLQKRPAQQQPGHSLRPDRFGDTASWRIREVPQVPPMLVVYRYGSVVFVGTQVAQEPALIEQYVPQYVRYKAGGDGNTWTMQDPMSDSRFPQEEQTVVVKPDALQPAVKGVDKVELQVFDVGSVRVLTSVLGQSVALKFYETSVGVALDQLSQWRARTRRAARYQRSGGLGIFAGSQEQTTLFKVIAASALIINEARELLEMAEPAWQYAAYHSIWSLAADDFELEKRFRALETKLHQVEEEAKHDVKQREGRKYHKLEQSVILLLVASCILALIDLCKTVVDNSLSSTSSIQDLAADAGAAGLSIDEGSMTDTAVDAVQQLRLQHEDATAAAAAAAADQTGPDSGDSSSSSEDIWNSSSTSSSSSSRGEGVGTRAVESSRGLRSQHSSRWWSWGQRDDPAAPAAATGLRGSGSAAANADSDNTSAAGDHDVWHHSSTSDSSTGEIAGTDISSSSGGADGSLHRGTQAGGSRALNRMRSIKLWPWDRNEE